MIKYPARMKAVESRIAAAAGLSVSDIKRFSPEELRSYLEGRRKKKFSFVSAFPVIGRGNVLRDTIQSTESINKDIDKILGL